MLDVFAAAVLAYVVILAAWGAIKTLRFQRRGSLLESIVASAFLPEKRRRYLALLTVEGSFLLLGSIAWGLTAVGLLPAPIGDLVFPLLFAAAVTALTAVTELGLRPQRLTDAQRAEIAREAPEVLRSLAFLPVSAAAPDERPAPRGP